MRFRKRPVIVDPGDWIIAEPDGEHYYPCKPEIFRQNYEPDLDSRGFTCHD